MTYSNVKGKKVFCSGGLVSIPIIGWPGAQHGGYIGILGGLTKSTEPPSVSAKGSQELSAPNFCLPFVLLLVWKEVQAPSSYRVYGAYIRIPNVHAGGPR